MHGTNILHNLQSAVRITLGCTHTHNNVLVHHSNADHCNDDNCTLSEQTKQTIAGYFLGMENRLLFALHQLNPSFI